jgi:hypothetical protein
VIADSTQARGVDFDRYEAMSYMQLTRHVKDIDPTNALPFLAVYTAWPEF